MSKSNVFSKEMVSEPCRENKRCDAVLKRALVRPNTIVEPHVNGVHQLAVELFGAVRTALLPRQCLLVSGDSPLVLKRSDGSYAEQASPEQRPETPQVVAEEFGGVIAGVVTV